MYLGILLLFTCLYNISPFFMFLGILGVTYVILSIVTISFIAKNRSKIKLFSILTAKNHLKLSISVPSLPHQPHHHFTPYFTQFPFLFPLAGP